MNNRCFWAGTDPIYIKYHDKEWGRPIHNDIKLFEMLCLEGMQAGLSWYIVLKKRPNYKKAFNNFNPLEISKYDDKKIKELLNNQGIVRNRLKINAIISNAKAFLEIKKEFGSFNKYIWSFVNNKTIVNKWNEGKEIPVKTEMSDNMRKDLKKRGFKFVGSTICYSFMQAVGMVNDHIVDCFCYSELS